ncbi:MAG: repeat-containing protein [Chitinophagaceae bacterium]|nr:repeat-containing protein [Chitinophagaceae bacterium]
MKKIILAVIICSSFLSACMKDTVTEKYVIFKPVYKSKDDVLAQVKSGVAQPINSTGKLFIKDHYVFLNEPDKGVHIIDFSNPAQPVNLSFINIPGNNEITVRDHYLYADCYTSLVILDIADPVNVKKINILPDVFPEKMNWNTVSNASQFLVSWVRKDTVIRSSVKPQDKSFIGGGLLFAAASVSSQATPSGLNGTGGSMAGMALLDDRMYAISGYDHIKIFNVANAAAPAYSQQFTVHNGTGQLETIFPFNKKLFIGAQAGISIYSLANPDAPAFESKFNHATVCDPIIADNDYAFITLRSGTACHGVINTLDILDIHNLASPVLLKSYNQTNPHGLSKDGNLLFVCDGAAGLKVYNASNISNLGLLKQFDNIEAFDVIAMNGLALCVAKNGLYFIDYQRGQFSIKSNININQ